MAHHTPPHSEDAERGILGSIMIDPESVTYAIESLDRDDFYNPANSIIFEAMKSLFMDNIAVDSLVVQNYLMSNKKLEAIGGNVYL
jgi:replicative DNA helicase